MYGHNFTFKKSLVPKTLPSGCVSSFVFLKAAASMISQQTSYSDMLSAFPHSFYEDAL
jgi:hypothetical protein